MSRLATTVPTACLIGAGAIVWALASKPLASDAHLDFPTNPFGINRSPYGEVFAMAMQGPVATYFDGPGGHDHGPGETCTEDHDHAEHDHIHDATCDHDQEPETAKPRPASLVGRFENLIASMDAAHGKRTNPRGESAAHKMYLRRQVEDRLRFAYNLDPAHYGNYNSLHFFLTEPSLGTRPQLTASAAKLAEDTIQYCLQRDDDPRPALTASAACTNIIELMIADSRNPEPKFTTAQMRHTLDLLDFSINRYYQLADHWTNIGHWALLSQMRIQECEDRYSFIRKIRDTQAAIIDRLEHTSEPQVSR